MSSFKHNVLLVRAARRGDLPCVKQLLSHDLVDAAFDHSAALFWASKNGHLDVVKMLLADERVDPTAKDSSCLYWAARKGRTSVVEALLKDGRANNKDRAINIAIKCNHDHTAQVMIDANNKGVVIPPFPEASFHLV